MLCLVLAGAGCSSLLPSDDGVPDVLVVLSAEVLSAERYVSKGLEMTFEPFKG